MYDRRLVHHDLEAHLYPDQSKLSAVDRIYTSGDGVDFLFYLGNRFTVSAASQGGRELAVEVVENLRSSRRYRLAGWDRAGAEVTLKWEGTVDRFEGSCVCIIGPKLVELSGFCRWFPTVEPTCQMEQFTYRLSVDLPPGWDLVTPGISHLGNTKERHYERLRPIEDIFLCAAPHFDCDELTCADHLFRLYTAGLNDSERQALISDFARSLEAMHRYFGPVIPGRGGAAVISPRGADGAEWGFERGDMWVMGDSLVRPLVEQNWVLGDFMPGPISLALHETIHYWIGLSLEFAEPSFFEAITQYLQNALGDEVFGMPGLSGKFFESYVPRIKEQLAKDDRPIVALTYNDQRYVHWYLKGSWAFWDLEASKGRDAMLRALSSLYRKHVGQRIDYDTVVNELASSLGEDVANHIHHWFKEPGLAPVHRKGD